MTDVPMIPTLINSRWTISLPQHRAERAEWITGWETERLDSMHANLRPGMVIYDIGTEEGDLSALFARWVDGRPDTVERVVRDGTGRVLQTWIDEHGEPGGIVLFEPNARVWPNIRAIFEANDLPMPLGFLVGFASHHISPGGDARLVTDWPSCAYGPLIADHGFQSLVERGDDLPNVTVDYVASVTRPPDAITMDVEGSELAVLQGAHNVLTQHRPLVWVSVHPMMLQYDYRAISDDVHRYMGDHGYRMEQLAIDHEAHYFYWPKERKVVLR